jgi:hypothetical protein
MGEISGGSHLRAQLAEELLKSYNYKEPNPMGAKTSFQMLNAIRLVSEGIDPAHRCQHRRGMVYLAVSGLSERAQAHREGKSAGDMSEVSVQDAARVITRRTEKEAAPRKVRA